MKITICGSAAFYPQIQKIVEELTHMRHAVLSINPPTTTREKSSLIREHMDKIHESDAILVVNLDKKGVPFYVGGNALMEMGLAFFFHKKIFLYNPLPEISYKDEIAGMNPIVINGDLKLIK